MTSPTKKVTKKAAPKKAPAKPEQAITAYLTFLKNPESLVNQAQVEKLRTAIAASSDPLERLLLRVKIDQQQPDGTALEQAFIDSVKSWADAHAITVHAFLAEGVDRSVLRRAGFRVPSKKRKRG